MGGPRVKPLVSDHVSDSKKPNRGCAPAIRKLKLDNENMSEGNIAKLVGCTPSNVHRVLQRFKGNISREQLQKFQENKSDILEAVQLRTINSVTDAKLGKSSALQLVTAVAILEDKVRLIRGQATSINVNALLDVADMLRSKQ